MSSPTRPDMVGRTLMSKLKVLRVLGVGGMGTVFEVEHLITKHHRALKVLHAQHEHSHETVARFIREAGVAGTLKTPYVVETYDAGTMEDGSAYVLMEMLSGRPLASLVEEGVRVPPGRIVGICCQVLEGLSVAHEAGVIHRDVKPDNIFLVRDEQGRERVKILDFGISKFTQGVKDYAGTLTNEGTMMGTPYYMSPEQASGARDIDERTDLYSVGILLYEALAGRRPFDGQTLAALVIRIHKGECAPLEEIAPFLAPGLAKVVQKAMSADREQRYRNAREMLAALIPFAESGYVASLDTLREFSTNRISVAEAPTLQRAAIPVVGTLAETMPASAPAMSLPPASPMEIEVDLALTRDAIAAGASRPGAGGRPRSAALVAIGAAAIVIGALGMIAWAAGGRPDGETATGPVGAAPGDDGTDDAAGTRTGTGAETEAGAGAQRGAVEVGAGPEDETGAPAGSEAAVEAEAERGSGRRREAPPRVEGRDPPRRERPGIERDNPYDE